MWERMPSCAPLTFLMATPPQKRTMSLAGASEAICRSESRRSSLAKTPSASFVSRDGTCDKCRPLPFGCPPHRQDGLYLSREQLSNRTQFFPLLVPQLWVL